jgi:hypothetical protein
MSQMASKEQSSTAVAAHSPPFHVAPWSTSDDYSGPAAVFQCPLPPFTSSGTEADRFTSQAGYPSLSYQSHNLSSPGSLNNDFLDSLQPSGSPRTTMDRNGSMHLGRENTGSNVDIPASLAFASLATESHPYQHDQGYTNMTVQLNTNDGNTAASSSSLTLHDAAAAAATTTTTAATTTAATTATTTAARGTETSDNISAPIVTVLADFSSSVFHSQAEIAGMSSAVADYITWMRKVPTGSAPPSTILVYVSVLEAVESRLREMREIAQMRPRAAFRDMVASLQALGLVGTSVCDSLAHLEKEFDKQSADVAEFFQTRYNACAALSEQARNVPHGTPDRRGTEESTNSERH